MSTVVDISVLRDNAFFSRFTVIGGGDSGGGSCDCWSRCGDCGVCGGWKSRRVSVIIIITVTGVTVTHTG